MNVTLHKSVVTDRKVSFIEVQRLMDYSEEKHPIMLSISKAEWLSMDRPEVITVQVDLG